MTLTSILSTFAKYKPALTVALLLFVAASIAVPILRGTLPRKHSGLADDAPLRPDALVVYYFRGNVRCPACRTLEACSREVVAQRFSADSRIVWRAIDYQKPGNEHFLTDYQLLSGGVVLVEFCDGRPRRWTALSETWNMTGDRAGLTKHLEERIGRFAAASELRERP